MEAHGFWVHVTGGASRSSSGSGPVVQDQVDEVSHYDFAAIEFSAKVSWGERVDRFPSPGSVEIVPGTDELIRDRRWAIKKSSSQREGLFRVELTTEPLLGRSWEAITWFFFFLLCGLLLLCIAALGMLGLAEAAKHVLTATVMFVSCFNAVYIIKLHALVTSSDAAITKVLIGLAKDVRFDSSSNLLASFDPRGSLDAGAGYSLGVNAAYLLVGIELMQGCAFLIFTFVFWKEKNIVRGLVVGGLMVMLGEIVKGQMHPKLSSKNKLGFASAIAGFVLLHAVLNIHINARIRQLMREDQSWYERWWQAFSRDEGNRQALLDLRQDVEDINDSIRLRSCALGDRSFSGRSLPLDDEGSDEPRTPRELYGVCARRAGSGGGGGGSEGLRPWSLLPWGSRGGKSQAVRGEHHDRLPRIRQQFLAARSVQKVEEAADLQRCMCPPWSEMGWRKRRELKLVTSMDLLFQQAACLRPVLQRKVEYYMSMMPEGVDRGWRIAPMRLGDSDTPHMALKSPERAVQKTMRCYGGDCSKLVDICRDALVFDRCVTPEARGPCLRVCVRAARQLATSLGIRNAQTC